MDKEGKVSHGQGQQPPAPWFVLSNEEGTVLGVYGAQIVNAAEMQGREIARKTGLPRRHAYRHRKSAARRSVDQHEGEDRMALTSEQARERIADERTKERQARKEGRTFIADCHALTATGLEIVQLMEGRK